MNTERIFFSKWKIVREDALLKIYGTVSLFEINKIGKGMKKNQSPVADKYLLGWHETCSLVQHQLHRATILARSSRLMASSSTLVRRESAKSHKVVGRAKETSGKYDSRNSI